MKALSFVAMLGELRCRGVRICLVDRPSADARERFRRDQPSRRRPEAGRAKVEGPCWSRTDPMPVGSVH